MGVILFPTDIWQYLWTLLIIMIGMTGVTGIRWVEVRDAAQDLTMNRKPPTTKNYPT